MGATAIAATALALGLDPALTDTARGVSIGVGALFASALALTAVRLLAGPGGLCLDRARGRLGLGLTGQRDVWWVPLAELRGIRVQPTDVRRDGDVFRLWTAALERTDGLSIVLLESPDHDSISALADDLAGETGLARLSDRRDDAADAAALADEAPAETRVRFGVRRGAALQGVLALFGASMAVVGGAMFTVTAEHPVFGLFFAPLLALLGLVLLAVPAVKRLAREELTRAGDRWTHGFRLGPLRWAQRTVTATRPRWRLRLQALRGATLELLGDDGALVMGSGATTRSRDDVQALTALPARFATPPPAPRSPAPPPPA